MKKRISAILILLILVPILVIQVFANGPPPSPYFIGENTDSTACSAELLMLYVLLTLIGIGVTVFLEWLIAHFFTQLLKYTKVVAVTNLITQLAMRLLYVFLYSFVLQNYFLWTLLLEVSVYMTEHLIYRRKMSEASPKTVFVYTVVANTVTLLVGLGINYIL